MEDEDLDLLLALADEAEEAPELGKQGLHHNSAGELAAAGPSGQVQTACPPQQRTTTTTAAATTNTLPSQGSQSLQSSSAPTAAAAPAAARAPAAPASRPQQHNRQVADGYTDRISGFRVSKPVIGSLVLKERLTDDCVYISLKDISPSRELSGRWATMAVLVSKVQASGRDGSSYSRWTLSDLAGKQVTLFLWRKAASEHYKELEGSLLLLSSPQVRRDEGGGGSSGGGASYSLHIDKPEMIQRPGMSADFGLCRGTRKDGQRCTIPINKSTCEYCPYHAQAALRALSSNRSDMAGANLLQRQLLPQARAAQKQLSAVTGRPLGGINTLIARPPPPQLQPRAGAPPTLMRSVDWGNSSLNPAVATGTGAYGISVSKDAGGNDGTVGSKRSYGAQLLANLHERQIILENGGSGPAAKKRRASAADALNDAPRSSATASVSAAKERAVAAARRAGQLSKHPSGCAADAAVTRTPLPAAAAAGTASAAAPPSSGTGAARRTPVAQTTPQRFSMPPPLPAHIASLLKPPAADGATKTPPAAAPAAGARDRATGQDVHRGPSFDRSSVAGLALRAGGNGVSKGAYDGGCDGDLQEGEEDLVIVDLEEEKLGHLQAVAVEDDDALPGGVGIETRRGHGTASQSGSKPGSGSGSGYGSMQGDEAAEGIGPAHNSDISNNERKKRLSPASKEKQHREHARCSGVARHPLGENGASAEVDMAGGGDEPGRDRTEGGGEEEECGLDELLEIFPELQQQQQQEEEVVAEEPDAEGQQESDPRLGEGGGRGGGEVAAEGAADRKQLGMNRVEPQSASASRAGTGPSGAQNRASGGNGGGVCPGTGTRATTATGLLPRVAGLGVAPSAKAAEARKQQAAAAKARAEKLSYLGLKAPGAEAVALPQANPLGAANAPALVTAKGFPAARGPARNATAAAQVAAVAAAAAAGAATTITTTTTIAPSSALAAAFGNLVRQLPETAVSSRYSELSEDAAGEAVISMLEGLEARDALVQQLDSITHLKVTAWHCAECNRLSEFLDKQCRAESHTLSKTTTLKRFWTCDHCNARITTLGVRFPANRCSRCNNPSLEFTACTMYRGPRELKPAGMAAASGLASKENLFATIEQHPEMGRRTYR